MKVIVHFRHPIDMPYPDRDWIMAYIESIGIILTPNEYNKVKRDAILTEEISETLPAKITHTIDYEATEIDEETGLDQDLKVTASVVYYG